MKTPKWRPGSMEAADHKDMLKLSIIAAVIAAALLYTFNFSDTFFHFYATNTSPFLRIIGTIALIANGLTGFAGMKFLWEGKTGMIVWIGTLLAGIFFSAGFSFILPE